MTEEVWIDELPPLVRAAARGEREVVRQLLAGEADPNEADPNGWSALHAAAVRDHAAVVRVLLAAGAAVDIRSSDGYTPLLNAASASAATIAALLDAGADPMAVVPRLEWRPVDRFAEHDNAPALQLILNAGADPDALRADGWSALADAAEAGSSACVTMLVEAGADPTRRFDGATASELAATHGHHDVAAYLAAREAAAEASGG